MQKSWAWFVLALGVLAGCARSDSEPSEALGVASQALTSTSVLGFESSSGWASSAGSLSLTAVASEGSAALALTGTGYAEVTSVPLTSLGSVGDTLTLDVRPSQLTGWGERRRPEIC